MERHGFVASAKVPCEENPYTIMEIGKSVETTCEYKEIEVNVPKKKA